MKLIQIYSNCPDKFRNVHFRDGLNVVLGRIKKPKAHNADTHNLGKTLFGQMIDFCLLKGKESSFFLFRYPQFQDFVFFLEIRTHTGRCLTIRRSVREASKASFMWHTAPLQDFSQLEADEWDHWQLPAKASRNMLDGMLDLSILSPWTYRQAVSYSLRSQRDYDEPFKLAKFAGSHSEWKPFLAHILGFDGQLVERGYAIEEELTKLKSTEAELQRRAIGIENADQLRGQIQIIEKEVRSIESEVERFDFSPADERSIRSLVTDIDARIVELNEAKYSAASDKAKVESAIGVRLSINVGKLQKLFEEAKVYFGEQVKKDYDALVKFNRELAEERDVYLRRDLESLDAQLEKISTELAVLNVERSRALESLTDAESLSKYKRLTKDLVGRQADLETLRRMDATVEELSRQRAAIREKETELRSVTNSLEAAVDEPSSLYEAIRAFFDEIVMAVVGRHANLFSRVNGEGHLEFQVEVLDEKAKPSSAGEGFSYGRLLCIAFDLAIMRAYVTEAFPHFVFHDGFLETLDDRKKLSLIKVSREYCRMGIQQIVTAIDSELPTVRNGSRFEFEPDEVILTLSDDGDEGRLFRMPAW